MKERIRQLYIDKRNLLSKDYVAINSKKICQNIKNFLKKERNVKNIAIYHPINNEVDLTFLMEFLQKGKYQIFLPKIIDNTFLEFGIFQEDNLINNNKISKIIEPKIVSDQIMDIILCPLVCFDTNYNRMGMGGGFYDRLIGKYRKNYPMTKFIGVAYKMQYYDYLLPMEKFDQKLDLVLSG